MGALFRNGSPGRPRGKCAFRLERCRCVVLVLVREEDKVGRHPVIGYLVWAVLFGALFAWEGLGLARVSGCPTLSDVFRLIMRYPVGRWAMFALWLWVGWHLFVRGWHFLLRA